MKIHFFQFCSIFQDLKIAPTRITDSTFFWSFNFQMTKTFMKMTTSAPRWWCKSPREIYRRQCTEDVKGFNLTSSPVSKNSFFQPKWMTTLQTQDKKPFWVDESMVHLCARKVIHCCPKIQFWPKLDLFEFYVKIEG